MVGRTPKINIIIHYVKLEGEEPPLFVSFVMYIEKLRASPRMNDQTGKPFGAKFI